MTTQGLKYYVIDTETTGLSAKRHEITQISIIRDHDMNQLTSYIKAEHPENASRDALLITGRTLADISRGNNRKDVVDAVNMFILEDGLTPEHRCIVGHNVGFDKRFCHAMWESVDQKFPANCWLDTKPFAKNWATKLGIFKPKLTLAASLEFAGIKAIAGAHDAGIDAQNTFILWQEGLKQGVEYLPCIKREPHE